MSLVTLLVVLSHMPYNIQLSLTPNGHVAGVKYLFLFFQVRASLFIFICSTPRSTVFSVFNPSTAM